MTTKRMIRVCNIHGKTYDVLKTWKCPECENKMAYEALLPNQERREAEIKRKQRGKIV